MQLLVKREYRTGDSTHPRRAPVFRMMVDDWRLLSLTDWGRSSRECRIQWQGDRGRDKCSCFSKSFCGTIVLKALLKSKNRMRVQR